MIIILLVLAFYFLFGLVFAIAFVSRGVGVIDPAAKEVGIAVRIMLLLGSTMLWPYLLLRWLRSS